MKSSKPLSNSNASHKRRALLDFGQQIICSLLNQSCLVFHKTTFFYSSSLKQPYPILHSHPPSPLPFPPSSLNPKLEHVFSTCSKHSRSEMIFSLFISHTTFSFFRCVCAYSEPQAAAACPSAPCRSISSASSPEAESRVSRVFL